VSHWGWRWIFFINIPIIILGFFFSLGVVKESAPAHQHASLDIKGMLLLAFALCGIVLGLIHGQVQGWINYVTLIDLMVGIAAIIWLIRVERRQKNPLIDLNDFFNLLFFSGAILSLLAGMLSSVTLFFDPLYLQIIQDQSPQFSGLILFTIPLALFFVAFMVGWLIARFGIMNVIMLGLALAALSALLQLFFSMHTHIGYIVLAFACLGSMWALGNTVSIIAAQSAVGQARKSVATGTLVTMFNMGGSLGLAMTVVIYHGVTQHVLQRISANHVPSLDVSTKRFLAELMANPAHSLQLFLPPAVRTIFNTIFTNGFVGVMSFLLALSAAALVFVTAWRRRQRQGAVAISVSH
jgi:predicted MFS family arabinose efflux permease